MLFRLKGIKSPGEVDIFGMGRVQLEKLPPEVQEKIYNDGCQFLEPTPEEVYKHNPVIQVKKSFS